MEPERDPPKKEPPPAVRRRPEMDEVNDASFDSFPASDAPVWSSMHAGPPGPRAGSAE